MVVLLFDQKVVDPVLVSSFARGENKNVRNRPSFLEASLFLRAAVVVELASTTTTSTDPSILHAVLDHYFFGGLWVLRMTP